MIKMSGPFDETKALNISLKVNPANIQLEW